MEAKIQYNFSGALWQHGTAGWIFVSLPRHLSKEIRKNLQWQEEGWGRMKALAKIKNIEWQTAIWFDKKRDTYLLPLKADVRKKLNITINSRVKVSIWI